MTKTIHKKQLTSIDRPFTFLMPCGYRLVKVAEQHGEITFWYEFRIAETDTRAVIFRIFGTGHEIPAGWDYCGTAICEFGDYVWHLYSKDA